VFQGHPVADHPDYCLRYAGRGIVGHTPDDLEMETSVAAASRYGQADPNFISPVGRHINVVQLATLLPDDTQLRIDYRPGEARSLAALLIAAADRADGVR
jgi:hypothetical protein